MGKWLQIQSLPKVRMAYKLSAVSMRKWKLIPSLRKLRMACKLSIVSMGKWELIPSLRKLKLILMDLARRRRYSRSQMPSCPVHGVTVRTQSSATSTITAQTNPGTTAGAARGTGLTGEL